jgi:hypothetical protein
LNDATLKRAGVSGGVAALAEPVRAVAADEAVEVAGTAVTATALVITVARTAVATRDTRLIFTPIKQ